MERGAIAEHSMDVTGAASGVGKALAVQFKDDPNVSMCLIGGRRQKELRQARLQTNASGCVEGDIFHNGSDPYNRIMVSCADVIAHIAAINLDTHEDESERDPLRLKQNDFLVQLLEMMKSYSSSNPRLLVVVNSVTAFFERESKNPGKFPYMRMKMEQADILSAARAGLEAAGIQLSIVYPGAIRTDMMKHIPDDQDALRLANIFGKRLRRVPGKSDGLIQDSIFQPNEVAEPIAKLINYFFVNGSIPEGGKEWIMANHADLIIPELQTA